MLCFLPDSERISAWKKFLGGLMAAALLLPIPAWALDAFTYDWTSITGTGWSKSVGGADDQYLYITPPANGTFQTVTITGTVTNNTGSSQTLGGGGTGGALFTGLEYSAGDGLGQFKLNSGQMGISINAGSSSLINNQFYQINFPPFLYMPSDSNANQFVKSVNVGKGTSHISVTFAFASNLFGAPVWSTSSTPFTLSFTP